MSFMDGKKKSDTLDANKSSLRIPGLVTEQSPADQLPFPDGQARASGTDHLPQFDFFESESPTVTGPITPFGQSSGPLTNPELQQSLIIPPAVTQQLAQTGALKPLDGQQPDKKAATRQPVVIRGTGAQKTSALPPVLKRSRLRTHATVAAFLLFVVIGSLLIAAQMSDAQMGAGIFSPKSNSVSSTSKNNSLLAQQAATATAVLTDGHDMGANTNQPGTGSYNPYLPSVSAGGLATDGDASSLNRFYYGQCTYWANYRYNQLTGHYVPWLGNANEWVAGAEQYGWIVSSQPSVPSIIQLDPGVQGAGAYGHVAVVEGINGDGSLNVSTWNWGAYPGAQTSYITLYPGAGVYFITF